jgi:hypothetical protein
MRRIEQRAEFPSGIKTAWQPTTIVVDERDARNLVTELNRDAKQKGLTARYRSVPLGKKRTI